MKRPTMPLPWVWVALFAGWALLVAAAVDGSEGRRLSVETVWPVVVQEAESRGLDPHLVLAVIVAESSLNPEADSGIARGLMQLSQAAWRESSPHPYQDAFDWRKNIAAGCAYLDWISEQLDKEGRLSPGTAAAAYHFGLGRVQAVAYDLSRLEPTNNRIYQALFAHTPPLEALR